jgi:hypothetical protein
MFYLLADELKCVSSLAESKTIPVLYKYLVLRIQKFPQTPQ